MAKNLVALSQEKGSNQLELAENAIHLSLQGKGGVGKSLVASILAQYFRDQSLQVKCIDTDPVNQTLAQYHALSSEHLELMRDSYIDQRGLDVLMERLLTEQGLFVIDIRARADGSDPQ